MIDCGVPLKKIKEHLYDIKYLLLTHIHGDHIKPSVLLNIKVMHPQITVIGNYEVHQHFGVNQICNAGFELMTDDYTFLPFECDHDVVTYGYTWEVEGQAIIYATDTSNMDNAPKQKYDWLFLESNYDKKKLEQIDTKKYEYNVIASAMRHLSTQDSKAFYYMNRRDKESRWVELHKSSRFF